jgi:isopenicillin N synthase-like dioxygenase
MAAKEETVGVLDAAPLFASGAPTAAFDAALVDALQNHGGAVIGNLPAAVFDNERAAALCSYFDLAPELKARQQVAVQQPGNDNLFWGYYSRHQGVGSSWLYNEHMQVCRDDALLAAAANRGSWSDDAGRFLPSADGRTDDNPDPHFLPNPWPDEALLPGWRAEMERFHERMEDVGERILRSVVRHFGSAALGVDEHEAAVCWSDGVSTLRPMRYPAPPDGFDPSDGGYSMADGRLVTAGAHADNGTGISMLWQSSGGLQVLSPTTGHWLDVPHECEGCPGGLISVHVGRGLQIMTADHLLATTHRVLSEGRKRDAVGFFKCPHPGATLPLEVPVLPTPALHSFAAQLDSRMRVSENGFETH